MQRSADGRQESLPPRPPGEGSRPGVLSIAATPIGQPGDASARLVEALRTTPVIAAEDTRRLLRLASALGVRLTARVVSYYDSVESRKVPALLADLEAGTDVLLVSDAGMPGVSDPGYRLVAAAAAAGIRVTALPGPSAVVAALAVSGLPTDRFAFEGFLPKKAGDRSRRLAELAADPRTLVLFESGRRLGETLTELAGALGPDRRAVVCRELTKTHEEVARGTLTELASQFTGRTLGEVTLVVAGAPDGPVAGASLAEAAQQVAARVARGERTKAAAASVASELGLRSADVYNEVHRLPPG
jgi:16S rRNA (cytidine1402-2'-O)-methyltransferase